MAKERYLTSTKKPGLKFKIIGKREEPGPDGTSKLYFTLEGAHGIVFERLISQEILDKYGYAVEVVEVPDDCPAF